MKMKRKEGEKLGPMIKGPLSVRDEIAWLMGAGSPFFRAHKIEYDYEKRHPRALEYVETEEADSPGDVPEIVHILNEFAQAIGVERAYDYGSQRMAWLCNLFTNWMGDEGFLWKMSGDERAFNLMGDITTFEGKVRLRGVDAVVGFYGIESLNHRDLVANEIPSPKRMGGCTDPPQMVNSLYYLFNIQVIMPRPYVPGIVAQAVHQ